MTDFPRHQLASIQELGARLLDGRKPKTPLHLLARDLLAGFHDICIRSGLDRVLVELAAAFPPLDADDRSALSEHETLVPVLAERLGEIDIDGGGPRGAKPRQVADAVVAALGLTLSDAGGPSITLGADVRSRVVAAIAGVVDGELAVPKIRDTMIAESRERCDPRHHGAFDKIAPRLDDRGMRIVSQAKVPLDAVQAVQRALFETRHAVIERVAGTAIDRAKDVIAGVDPDAAARIDLPVSLRLTPREVAILRACEARVPTTPAAVAEVLLDGISELARLAWRTAEKPVRAYKASETFAVGDVVEHPKFGRGSVISDLNRRIEVEFADGKRTLVHVGKS
jgi:hypothetical protein